VSRRAFEWAARWSCVAAALIGCGRGDHETRTPPSPDAAPGSQFEFVDVAAAAGLTRVLHAGRPGKDHLLDSAGTGAAWLDFDLDGHLDVYLVNGWLLDGDQVVARGENALYRNDGQGGFVDVTRQAGVTGEGRWGSGVAVADYDDDGFPDLLVTNFGKNLLYRNRGDGTFEDRAAEAGVEAPGWNTGAAFFDADQDGDLDLYIAAYIDVSVESVLEAERTLVWKGLAQVAVGPFGLPGAADHFFLSDGRGGFHEATAEAGLADRALGYGFGVRALDLEPDGDLDLYVANDSDANYVYRNEGQGRFREIGMWAGAAFDEHGAAQAGMGVAAGDPNGDGLLDLFVTNFSEDFSTLYLGDGRGFFEDASLDSGVGPATHRPLSWGTVFADLDCDGDQDLVVANGHIYPQVDEHPEQQQSYGQVDLLLENLGGARFPRFRPVSDQAGPGFQLKRSSRGLAAGDYDNDGDLDLLITALDSPPALLRNESRRGSWLTVILEVPPGGGTAIGTRVLVRAGERTLLRDCASSGSYLSAHDPRLHFGLGRHAVAEQVEVRWPDGQITRLEYVPAGQFLRISPP